MISREDVADLRPGDVVELHSPKYEGVLIKGPLRAEGRDLLVGDFPVRYWDGYPAMAAWSLTVVSRAPRPLYVNHDRTEPVPGDVVRDADSDGDRRTWMRRGNTTAPEWIRVVDGPEVRTCSTLIDAHDRREHMPHHLLLLVDGETGQAVTA